MNLVILKNYADHCGEARARTVWCDLVELRQRTYRQQYARALVLDKYDLLATHVLLYSRTGMAIAYIRAVASHTCRGYAQDLPLQELAKELTASFSGAVAHFIGRCTGLQKNVVQLGFLCTDPRFKDECPDLDPVDFLVWVALWAEEADEQSLAFCATPNRKYHLLPRLAPVGPRTEGAHEFIHPVIPEPHELVLVPALDPAYWHSRRLRYDGYLDNTDWIGSIAHEEAG